MSSAESRGKWSTTAASTPPGRSVSGSATPACSAPLGTVGDALDNAVAESFFATLQTELLDRHHWHSRRQLAQAIFEWIEVFYNPIRRHSILDMLSPADYDRTRRTPTAA